MTRTILFTSLLWVFGYTGWTQPATPAKTPYKISLDIPGYSAGIAYLCYHFGKNLNIQDSAAVSPQGKAVFSSDKDLPGGIYAIVFPGRNRSFDFFIHNERNISLRADSNDLSHVQIQGAPENKLFQEYQQFVNLKGSLMQRARESYALSTTKADSMLHQEAFLKYQKELNDYREEVLQQQPQSMMAVMLQAMKEPDPPIKSPKTRQDSLYNYYYYKKHYWDGVTFMDERVIRTPFFLPRLERYYREWVTPDPDSIIQDLDYKLLLARSCPEMYKFLLNWLTDEYLNPKIMGQDAVLVHLFEKYHSKGLSPWLNEKQQETISRRAYMTMSNLIGVKAADLDMVDSTGKVRRLYDVNAEYLLVLFWDPTCGHCREDVPRIDSIYRASWKARGVKVYSVLSENSKKKEWVNYLKEHKLGDWINVYETPEMEKAVADAQRPGFRQLYDVIQTPTLLMLDKDKRIIGKKLGWEQINELLLTKWGKDKPAKP